MLDVTGVVVAIGHDPRSELFKGQVELEDEGYVKVDHPSTRTNAAGVSTWPDTQAQLGSVFRICRSL